MNNKRQQYGIDEVDTVLTAEELAGYLEDGCSDVDAVALVVAYEADVEAKVYTSKRQQYGVYVDLIGAKVTADNKPRLTDVRTQVAQRGYRDIEAAAEQLYKSSMDYIGQYGYKAGAKLPTVRGKRFHLLCSAKGVIFYTYQYQHVDADIKACLNNGTPVTVFSPYKVPDMVQVTSLGLWQDLLAVEKVANKQFYTSDEYAKWEAATKASLTFILNTPTPWLGALTRLHSIVDRFNTFNDFLLHAEATIADIEAEGEWDIELTSSLVMNEKASTATYVANKGVNKGQRTFWCKDNADDVAYWYNYETLPADICTKYLHLTYLRSTVDKQGVPFKALKKIHSLGAEMSGKELWFGTALEDMVRTTPIYVDTCIKHEKTQLYSDDIDLAYIRTLDYASAKKYLAEIRNK